MIDCKELNERVRASGYKKKHLAHAMGITANTLRNKLTGKSAFKLGRSPAAELPAGAERR